MDLISRQMAIDAIRKDMYADKDYMSAMICDGIESVLRGLPSVQERKGRWIDKSGGIENAWNYCSVCGEQAIDLYDYCPNCGAHMEGAEDAGRNDINS